MGDTPLRPRVRKAEAIAIYPIPQSAGNPRTTFLSILDATVAKFATTSAVWFYPPTFGPSGESDPFTTARLETSLQNAIFSSYPFLAGQLHWAHSPDAPFAPVAHEKRFRRLAITYFADSDPGALYVKASCDSHSLAELLPSPDQRPTEWEPAASGWTTSTFIPDLNLLAFHNFPHSDVVGSCFAVQITKFKCGGTAIGVAFSHQIADAIVMSGFMHDWSRIHAAVLKNETIPIVRPTFQPALLDEKAAGDIDRHSPDAEIIRRARQSPILRYDYWIDKDRKTVIDNLPPELKNDKDVELPRDTPITWSDWNRKAATSRVLHFTAQEITNMYNAAVTSFNAAAQDSEPSFTMTKHDVALAHVWQCINTARTSVLNLPPETETFLTTTLGVRSRLSLPQNFIGSPLLITYVSRPASTFETTTTTTSNNAQATLLSHLARSIHTTQSLFTRTAIAEHLHDAAFELCPHRLWATMLGSRHTLSTSWIHTRVYEDVDFGCDGLVPWYVYASIEEMDGLVMVLEARPGELGRMGTGDGAKGMRAGMEEENTSKTKGKWYDRGVDVSVALQREVMENMLAGALLRRWRRE